MPAKKKKGKGKGKKAPAKKVEPVDEPVQDYIEQLEVEDEKIE